MDDRPLPEYATLTVTFGAVLGGFLLLAGDRLPTRIGFGDMARIGLASFKLGRLIAKDEVTAFIRAPVTEGEESGEEEPKGEGCSWLWVSWSPVPTASASGWRRASRVASSSSLARPGS
jgi:hypothetical protein